MLNDVKCACWFTRASPHFRAPAGQSSLTKLLTVQSTWTLVTHAVQQENYLPSGGFPSNSSPVSSGSTLKGCSACNWKKGKPSTNNLMSCLFMSFQAFDILYKVHWLDTRYSELKLFANTSCHRVHVHLKRLFLENAFLAEAAVHSTVFMVLPHSINKLFITFLSSDEFWK